MVCLTPEQVAAIGSFGAGAQSLFANTQDYEDYLRDRIQDQQFGNVLYPRLNDQKFSDYISKSYNPLLGDASDYIAESASFGSAAALDVAKAIRPADPNAYYLRWDFTAKGFVPSSQATSYFTFKNIGTILGKAVLPVAASVAAVEAANAIAHGDDAGAAKVATKFAVGVGLGALAVVVAPAAIGALGAATIGAGLGWIGGKVIDAIWDDVYQNVQNGLTPQQIATLYETANDTFVDDILNDIPVNGIDDPYWGMEPDCPIGSKGIPDGIMLSIGIQNGGVANLAPGGGGGGAVCPLVLDLDGDGIEVSKMGYGVGASTTYFDLDNDGFAERTAWVKGGDGLLALDLNANGKIDNKTELFGDNPGFADGFAQLRSLDSNSSNSITSADT